MGSLIISLIVCALLIVIDYHFIEKSEFWGLSEKGPGALTGAAIIYFITVLPTIHMSYNKTEVQHLEYKEEVVAMSDTSGIHGSISGGFLFMSGSIDSGLEYNFYVKDKRGGYILKTAPARAARIIEKKTGPYTVTKYNYRLERKESTFFFSTKSNIRRSDWVFVIPPKSIVKQFKLDME